MKSLPYLFATLLVGGCMPQETPPSHVYSTSWSPAAPSEPVYSWSAPKNETGQEFLVRMCKDAANEAAHEFDGSFEMDDWYCEQQNPQLARKLKAEYEKFLTARPTYYGSGSYEAPIPDPPDPFAEEEKAQQQFYHDEQIRSDQQMLDWAFEPMER